MGSAFGAFRDFRVRLLKGQISQVTVRSQNTLRSPVHPLKSNEKGEREKIEALREKEGRRKGKELRKKNIFRAEPLVSRRRKRKKD